MKRVPSCAPACHAERRTNPAASPIPPAHTRERPVTQLIHQLLSAFRSRMSAGAALPRETAHAESSPFSAHFRSSVVVHRPPTGHAIHHPAGFPSDVTKTARPARSPRHPALHAFEYSRRTARSHSCDRFRGESANELQSLVAHGRGRTPWTMVGRCRAPPSDTRRRARVRAWEHGAADSGTATRASRVRAVSEPPSTREAPGGWGGPMRQSDRRPGHHLRPRRSRSRTRSRAPPRDWNRDVAARFGRQRGRRAFFR